MADHIRALFLKDLLPSVDIGTIRRFLVLSGAMDYFFFGFALALQKPTSIFFGPDDLSNPRSDLLGLMRPDFLFDIDLLMWWVILVLAL